MINEAVRLHKDFSSVHDKQDVSVQDNPNPFQATLQPNRLYLLGFVHHFLICYLSIPGDLSLFLKHLPQNYLSVIDIQAIHCLKSVS